MANEIEFIRRPEVLRITGLKKSTLYTLMRRGEDPFPPSYPISERGRAWSKVEVLAWCARRKQVGRKPTPIEVAMRQRREG